MPRVSGEGGAVLISDSAQAAVESDDAAAEAPSPAPAPAPAASAGEENIEDDTVRRVHKEKDFISLLSSTPGQFN